MSDIVTPSLETVAGLYRAAREQQVAADLAMQRVLESAARHGFGEKQLAVQIEAPATGGCSCAYCGGTCAEGDCAVVFTPITDCEHKNAEDGCCSHPKNMTPECHVGACPRLHRRIKI